MKKFVLGIITLVAVLVSSSARATNFSTISENAVTSVQDVPGLVSGGAYLLGLVLGALGIVKLKQHVEVPTQHNLKDAVVRLAAGGALFALPMVYQAALNTISGGALMNGITGTIQGTQAAMTAGGIGGTGVNINQILANITDSLQNTPGLLSGGAYLLALMFGLAGILQLKDHVINPDSVPLRSGVTKILAAGSLFGLTAIIGAVWYTISNGGGAGGLLGNLARTANVSKEAGNGTAIGASSLGSVLQNLYNNTSLFPLFLAAMSYLFAIVLTIWGILKLKEHIINPDRTTVWEGVSRLIAGGGLFGLPYVIEAVMQTVGGGIGNHNNTGSGSITGATGAGLDAMLADFMNSIYGPTDIIIEFFGYVAGIILVMIGISRLMKSAQEGPRGPGGMGTLVTFVAGGALLSFSPMIAAFTMSLFMGPRTTVVPELQYTAGLDGAEIDHIEAVVSAAIEFVLLLGLVSFMRGIFIIRGVAEGNTQASMMAGVTHLVGGALAVNLGPFINAVEWTLGLQGYGLMFR